MGKYITEIEQVYQSMTMMMESIKGLPELQGKLLASKLCLAYEITDPEGKIYLDFSGKDIEMYLKECPPRLVPTVTLKLTADTMHLYWLGKINFMIASFKGDIKVTGNLMGLTKLVPLSEQLFKVYTENLKKSGMAALIPA
jgi:hypothetical protein